MYRKPFPDKKLGSLWGVKDAYHKTAHRGVDWSVPSDSRIKSVADGVVVDSGWSDALGNYVIVFDQTMHYWGFNHMKKPSRVAKGINVKKGQTLGFVGDTGSAASGPHLHLTCSKSHKGNFVGTTINPLIRLESHVS